MKIKSQTPKRQYGVERVGVAGRGEVRIIGGRWKRTSLPVPDVEGLRPTPDRVRETLFNWLGQDLSGCACLDAFAGTGALGLEAASRGAASVWLLDNNASALRHLEQACSKLQARGVHVVRCDALAWMARCGGDRFDVVFLDPPFGADLFMLALQAARACLKPRGLIYLEADRVFTDEQLLPLRLALRRHGQAGQVHYHLIEAIPG